MRKKTFFFTGLLVCLVVAALGYYQYQKPRTGVENKDTDYTIKADELFYAFEQDEVKANKMYVDKVIEIEGVVQQVDTLQGSINLFLSGANRGGVNCSMATLKKVPFIGDHIIVKGRCTGFLMDVTIVDAVIK